MMKQLWLTVLVVTTGCTMPLSKELPAEHFYQLNLTDATQIAPLQIKTTASGLGLGTQAIMAIREFEVLPISNAYWIEEPDDLLRKSLQRYSLINADPQLPVQQINIDIIDMHYYQADGEDYIQLTLNTQGDVEWLFSETMTVDTAEVKTVVAGFNTLLTQYVQALAGRTQIKADSTFGLTTSDSTDDMTQTE